MKINENLCEIQKNQRTSMRKSGKSMKIYANIYENQRKYTRKSIKINEHL